MTISRTFFRFLKKRIPLQISFHQTSHGRMAVRNRFSDLAHRIKTSAPIIVDAGASIGNTIELFLNQYPSAKIHAFEPIPDSVQLLENRYATDPRVTIHNKALGAENRIIPFYITKNSGSSSILPPTDINRYYQGEKIDIEQTIEVQQVRLDETLNEDIDLLKLDLQGYELEALKGSEQLLKKIKTITTEIEFLPLYGNQPLFADIDMFLRDKDFFLLNLYELWTHPDGQLTAGDAVYLNKSFFTNQNSLRGN